MHGSPIFTVAIANFVGSTVDVAVTLTSPRAIPVTTPAVETVASVGSDVDHVTAVGTFGSAVTTADRFTVAPGLTRAVGGVTVTARTEPITTEAVAVFALSAIERAVIVTVPAVTPVTTP